MKKSLVIYCPSLSGFWANAYNAFKGELFATTYQFEYVPGLAIDDKTAIQQLVNSPDFERALKAADGRFVEIKTVYRYESK